MPRFAIKRQCPVAKCANCAARGCGGQRQSPQSGRSACWMSGDHRAPENLGSGWRKSGGARVGSGDVQGVAGPHV
jgi:hypothetical protein